MQDALSTVKPLSGKEGAKTIFICNPAAVLSTFCDRFARAELASSAKAESTEREDIQSSGPNVSTEEVAAARQAWKSQTPVPAKSKRSGPV